MFRVFKKDVPSTHQTIDTSSRSAMNQARVPQQVFGQPPKKHLRLVLNPPKKPRRLRLSPPKKPIRLRFHGLKESKRNQDFGEKTKAQDVLQHGQDTADFTRSHNPNHHRRQYAYIEKAHGYNTRHRCQRKTVRQASADRKQQPQQKKVEDDRNKRLGSELQDPAFWSNFREIKW